MLVLGAGRAKEDSPKLDEASKRKMERNEDSASCRLIRAWRLWCASRSLFVCICGDAAAPRQILGHAARSGESPDSANPRRSHFTIQRCAHISTYMDFIKTLGKAARTRSAPRSPRWESISPPLLRKRDRCGPLPVRRQLAHRDDPPADVRADEPRVALPRSRFEGRTTLRLSRSRSL